MEFIGVCSMTVPCTEDHTPTSTSRRMTDIGSPQPAQPTQERQIKQPKHPYSASLAHKVSTNTHTENEAPSGKRKNIPITNHRIDLMTIRRKAP